MDHGKSDGCALVSGNVYLFHGRTAFHPAVVEFKVLQYIRCPLFEESCLKKKKHEINYSFPSYQTSRNLQKQLHDKHIYLYKGYDTFVHMTNLTSF